jgi:cell division protein ZapA
MEKDGYVTEAAPQTIKVEIYNQVYNIRGDGNNEYVQDLATYVDEKMREISSNTLTVDSLRVAILAAVNIADELHQLKKQNEEMDKVLGERSGQFSNLLDQYLKKGSDLGREDSDF